MPSCFWSQKIATLACVAASSAFATRTWSARGSFSLRACADQCRSSLADPIWSAEIQPRRSSLAHFFLSGRNAAKTNNEFDGWAIPQNFEANRGMSEGKTTPYTVRAQGRRIRSAKKEVTGSVHGHAREYSTNQKSQKLPRLHII